MSNEEFKKRCEGFIVKRVEVPKTMCDQGSKFSSEIMTHQFCFNRRKKNYAKFYFRL